MTHLRWKVNEREVTSEVIDGELIIMHLRTGKYFSSAGVGPLVWSCLAGGMSGEEIAQTVAQSCSVTVPAVTADVEAFISSLNSEELVREATEPVSASQTVPAVERMAYAKPVLQIYSDMQDLLLLDPIHDVSEEGWPMRPPPSSAS